jgi:hypothetical protein
MSNNLRIRAKNKFLLYQQKYSKYGKYGKYGTYGVRSTALKYERYCTVLLFVL